MSSRGFDAGRYKATPERKGSRRRVQISGISAPSHQQARFSVGSLGNYAPGTAELAGPVATDFSSVASYLQVKPFSSNTFKKFRKSYVLAISE